MEIPGNGQSFKKYVIESILIALEYKDNKIQELENKVQTMTFNDYCCVCNLSTCRNDDRSYCIICDECVCDRSDYIVYEQYFKQGGRAEICEHCFKFYDRCISCHKFTNKKIREVECIECGKFSLKRLCLDKCIENYWCFDCLQIY